MTRPRRRPVPPCATLRTRSLFGTLLVAGIVAGCSSSESSSRATSVTPLAPDDTTATTASPPTTDPGVAPTTTTTVPADDATVAAIVMQLGPSPPGFDPLDTRACVPPFPSDALTVDDDTSPTTRRVAFPEQGLPANSSSVTIDPSVEPGRQVQRPSEQVMYGHDVLRSHLEVTADDIVAMSNEHNAIYCATNRAGFSDDDIPTAAGAPEEFSTFPEFVDRMSQGLVNQLAPGLAC